MEDDIVAEYDVFLNPTNLGRLMLLQYPLRPRYCPYGNQGDLQHAEISEESLRLTYSIDTKSGNYDKSSSDFKLTTHVLESSCIQPLNTYFVGVIRDEKVVLTPINQIFQMRPSMEHVDKRMSTKEISVTEQNEIKAQRAANRSKVYNKRMNKPTEEVQVTYTKLECNGMESEESKNLFEDLLVSSQDTLMQTHTFGSLLPPPYEAKGTLQALRQLPASLQLEELLVKVQVPSPELIQESIGQYEEILELLNEKAVIVQKRWVAKSELFGEQVLVRDLILASFHKVGWADSQELLEVLEEPAVIFPILKQIATRTSKGHWELLGDALKL